MVGEGGQYSGLPGTPTAGSCLCKCIQLFNKTVPLQELASSEGVSITKVESSVMKTRSGPNYSSHTAVKTPMSTRGGQLRHI